MNPPPPDEYVAYPRQQKFLQIGPGRGKVRLEALANAWQLLISDWPTFVLASMILVGVVIVLSIPTGIYAVVRQEGASRFRQPLDVEAVRIVGNLVIQVVAVLLTAGVMNLGLLRLRRLEAGLGCLFDYRGKAGSLIAYALFQSLLTLITLVVIYALTPVFMSESDPMAGVFPLLGIELALGLVFMILLSWLVFVPLLILDQGMGTMQAIQTSVRTVGGQGFAVFGLLFVTGLASLLGICAVCVGLLFTMPLYWLVQTVLYYDFFRPVELAPSSPVPMNPEAPSSL